MDADRTRLAGWLAGWPAGLKRDGVVVYAATAGFRDGEKTCWPRLRAFFSRRPIGGCAQRGHAGR